MIRRKCAATPTSRKRSRPDSPRSRNSCGAATRTGSGHALRADMVKLLGAARFWFVDWPEGIKDANEYLLKDGPEALELVSDGALQWPIAGIYRLTSCRSPPAGAVGARLSGVGEQGSMLAPRTLSVVTGHPGHGKTVLWRKSGFRSSAIRRAGCIASFETRQSRIPPASSDFADRTAGERPFERTRPRPMHGLMSAICFWCIPEQRPTLEWFLDMAEVAVVRHGARIIQLDPWNRLEASRGRDESETEYIGRCLRTIACLCHDMNVHVQILAHPAKMDGTRRGQAPGLKTSPARRTGTTWSIRALWCIGRRYSTAPTARPRRICIIARRVSRSWAIPANWLGISPPLDAVDPNQTGRMGMDEKFKRSVIVGLAFINMGVWAIFGAVAFR
jgi:hypothetical protein